MKTLLIINDKTPQGDHAAQFALLIAQASNANVIIANACKTVKNVKQKCVFTGGAYDNESLGECEAQLIFRLIDLNSNQDGFRPEITEVDISVWSEIQLSAFSNKEQIWMIIKGIGGDSAVTLSPKNIDINALMNKDGVRH